MKIRLLFAVYALLSALIGGGCANIKPQHYRQMPSKKNHEAYAAVQAEMDGTRHGIWIPANTNIAIKPWRKFDPVWEIFGNADDPKPPKDYLTNQREVIRKIAWWGRNPFHNLFFYGIGVADKDTVRFGKYPGDIGNPNNGWNTATVAYKRVRLPFISYTGDRFQFYFGWRNHGNFGAKINFVNKKRKKDADPPPSKPRQLS